MNKIISFSVDEKVYQKIDKAKTEAEFDFMSEFMRGLVDVMFSGKFSRVESNDLNWIKYLYVIGIGVKKLIENFDKSQPDNIVVKNYLKAMTTGINNLLDSVCLTDEYCLSLELEGLYVDSINLFYGWLDQNDLTEYKVKRLAEKLKQNYRDNK